MNRKMPVGVTRRHGTKPSNEKAPRFLEELGSLIAKVGRTTIIDCVVKGEADYDIDCEWYFDGKLIKDEGRFRYLYEREDVVGLEIGNISVEDEGEYKCVAINKHGKTESRCEILVNVEGKVIEAPKDSAYEENQAAMFRCKYDGNPRPEVKWFLGKKEIKNGNKYNILNKNQVASLEIYDLTLDDKGAYSIVVSNDAGEDEVNFYLTVTPSKGLKSEKGDNLTMSSIIDVGHSCKHVNTHKFTSPTKKMKVSKMLAGRHRTKHGNPEVEYDFLSEIGRGRFSVVKECRCKRSRNLYAAKIIRCEEADFRNLEIAIGEYDLMSSGVLDNKCIPKLHETWIVRKYLILIMDLCEGLPLLDHFANRNRLSEEDIVNVIKQLCRVLADLHSKNIVHMDIRPSNILYSSSGIVKLVDFGSARRIRNKKSGCTTRTIGHLEFCAPEVVEDDAVLQGSDMWSMAVVTYILCSGISPFFLPTTEQTIKAIQKVNWKFDEKTFVRITSEAKDFIKRFLVRIPEMRSSAEEATRHKWLSCEYRRTRMSSVIAVQEQMKETCNRLNAEEEEKFLEASLVFRTSDEEEYDSPGLSDAYI